MKTLTLTQPWATLVAIGAKRIETRSWATNYRGPLAIHAAKGWKREDRELLCPYGAASNPFVDALYHHYALDNDLIPLLDNQRGKVIATCTLRTCFRFGEKPVYPDLDRGVVDPIREPELSFGNFAPGRCGWMLTDVVMLPEPIPAKGALGLWEWSPP